MKPFGSEADWEDLALEDLGDLGWEPKAGKDVAGPGNPNGRVRAMLAPRNGGPAPLNGASATLTPATQFPAPGPGSSAP